MKCVVCLKEDCGDEGHASISRGTQLICDALSLESVLRRREPTYLDIGDLRIRVVIDPTLPPDEIRLVCGPRPEQQVRLVNVGEG